LSLKVDPGAGSPEYLIFFPSSAAANDGVTLVQDLFEFAVRDGPYITLFSETALPHQDHERYDDDTSQCHLRRQFEDGVLFASLGPHGDLTSTLLNWAKALGTGCAVSEP